MNSRKPLSRSVRELVLAEANGRCAYCSAVASSLDIHHIVPISMGGTSEPSNLEAICSNCNHRLSRSPSAAHFVTFLTALVRNNSRFKLIPDAQIDLEKVRPDIAAFYTSPRGEKRRLLIECRSLSVLTGVRAEQTLQELRQYPTMLPGFDLVLAFPGRISPETRRKFSESRIEIWDVDAISVHFAEQITQDDDTFYGSLFRRASARQKPELAIMKELKDCPSGLSGWSAYQKLIGRALEILFCPVLGRPFAENADKEKVNRRDFIFPNYASEGFWLTMRLRYGADYILVDAKNGKGKTSKSNVLQIANYLKPHGVGQFAIILGRQGADRGAELTIREQWLMHSKMIVVLDAADLDAMLLASASEGDPAEVISDKIQQFRLKI